MLKYKCLECPSTKASIEIDDENLLVTVCQGCGFTELIENNENLTDKVKK